MAHAAEAEALVVVPPRGGRGWRPIARGAWNFARRKPLGAFGGLIIVAMVFAAIFADTSVITAFQESDPLLAPQYYDQQDISSAGRLQNPSLSHPFGTDQLGRDMFSRIIYGTRTSVLVGLTAVLIATVLSTLIGVVSGYFGGVFDSILQRLVDIWIAFPALVLLLTFVEIVKGYLGNDPAKQAAAIAIALGILLGGASSRVIRGATIAVKNNQYMESARAIGATDSRIILQHVVPNVMPVIIVIATLQLGTAILAEATVSFLGFGVPPPIPSWGQMLSADGLLFFRIHPWLAFFPGMAIALAVYGFNMLGDALRDVLDPRLRGGTGGVGSSRTV
jgi:peptide/nickel transport system permease protein